MSVRMAISPEDVSRIEHSLFFEPPQMRERLTRFVVLITLASIIASGGLISDSVASVIGAMIISPLMTPIMGIVVAVVLGSAPRALRSAVIVGCGVVIAVAVGWLMAKFMPGGWNPLTSDQVIGRTSPHLLDLVIALASGAAGAYAISRSDIADSLPGVAIAISLVPPLNNAGILLAAGEQHLAVESFLLFLTNFLAILLAGLVTFVLTGLALQAHREPHEVRNAIIVALVLIALVAIPLRRNSSAYWTDVQREDDAVAVVDDWLSGTEWELYEVDVDSDAKAMTLVLGGEGALPDTEPIVDELTSIMGGEVTLTARIVDVNRETLYRAEDS